MSNRQRIFQNEADLALELMNIIILSAKDSSKDLYDAEIENPRKKIKSVDYVFENPEMLKMNLVNNASHITYKD